MCYGFGCLIVWEGNEQFKLLFSEPDSKGNISHGTIINRAYSLGRLNIPDTVLSRKFVRVEVATWKEQDFKFDEPPTLPTWVENNRDDIQNACVKLMEKVQEKFLAYKETRKARMSAYRKSWGSMHMWDGWSPEKAKALIELKTDLKDMRSDYRKDLMLSFDSYVGPKFMYKRARVVQNV